MSKRISSSYPKSKLLIHGLQLATIIIILITSLSSCSNKDNTIIEPEVVKALPVINVDSIFVSLDEEIINKKAASVDKVFSNLRKKVGFNGTVLYAEQGRIIYNKAWGFADIRNRRNNLNADDRFQLSSVSKMFTAEAIMILKNEGKIDYDTDIREYIPEFPYEGITTRLLLNHRSGLPRYESLADAQWPDRKKPFLNEDMIEYYVIHKPSPYFKPNGGFNYSNVNYALLASIIERTSDMSFADYMKTKIFEPLGMDDSYIYEMDPNNNVSQYIEDIVQGYYMDRRRPMQAPNEYLNGVKGDKMMISNTEDMFKFMTAVDYGLLLPDTIQDEAFKPGSPKSKKRKDNYGFGWRIPSKYPGCYYHYGWWKAYRSFFIRDDVNDKTIIVLTNTSKGPSSDHFWKIINDKTNPIPEASVNITYWEAKTGSRFPYSSYRNRIIEE
ncbi:MAG: beta-lactamase family protein [Bacteroidales bacterium]|nr:beta-lactamase family protein [Bacteroidales bacterium]